MTTTPGGHIVTFYSYKGGVGRTLALANVAWILASNGRRVLTIDWDLEAPALHRYFAPFLQDPSGESTPGLIDLLTEFSISATTTEQPSTIDADILQYVQPVSWSFPQDGFVDLMSAGRYGPVYATRVNTFDWQSFYEKCGGAEFLERLKSSCRAEYDYVLIDSRTGVSDVSGICTVQMPDTLVVGFTLSPQSLHGAVEVVRSVLASRRHRPLRVLPVPMRLEMAEKDLLEQGLAQARSLFKPFMMQSDEEQRQYWHDVAFFSSPFYAYNEILAVFGDRHRNPGSLMASSERLARHLTDGQVETAPTISEKERQAVLARYAGRPSA